MKYAGTSNFKTTQQHIADIPLMIREEIRKYFENEYILKVLKIVRIVLLIDLNILLQIKYIQTKNKQMNEVTFNVVVINLQ